MLLAFAAAFLAWAVAEIQYNFMITTLAGALVAALMFVVAAFSPDRRRIAFGVGVVAMFLFYLEVFAPFEASMYFWAMLLFLLGLVGLTISDNQGPIGLASGILGILGPLMWVYLDRGSLWWEPGNVAALAGFGLALASREA
jgi:hypothetical protein